MSFDTTNGTRGGRQPKGAFLKWTNKVMSGRIARKGKAPGMGFDALVLVTVGAKSGEERRIPLGWFPGKDGSWLVVAAAAGAPKNPAWYYNLAAHPDRVSIEVPGGPIPVRAEQLHGAERDEAWRGSRSSLPQRSSASTRRRPTASCPSSGWSPQRRSGTRSQCGAGRPEGRPAPGHPASVPSVAITDPVSMAQGDGRCHGPL